MFLLASSPYEPKYRTAPRNIMLMSSTLRLQLLTFSVQVFTIVWNPFKRPHLYPAPTCGSLWYLRQCRTNYQQVYQQLLTEAEDHLSWLSHGAKPRLLWSSYTNMFIVKSFKWDYFWALITLVRKSFQPYIFRELMKTTGFRHDWYGYPNGVRYFWTRQPYFPSPASRNSQVTDVVLDRPMHTDSDSWHWKICCHCLSTADPGSSAKQEDDISDLFPLLYWGLQFYHQYRRNGFDSYFMFAYGKVLESDAAGELQLCRPHWPCGILSRLYEGLTTTYGHFYCANCTP